MSANRPTQAQALLVFPHLWVQNANAISSPLTHGFPSMTAFTGLMWALERKLVQAGIPLHLLKVGVVCHAHDEQVVDGYVKTFRLTRNPVDQHGNTAAIVEEGRIHLDITLVFAVAQASAALPLAQAADDPQQKLAQRIADVLATLRIAGGTVLPSRKAPGRRMRPWLALLPEDAEAQATAFKQWRRQWLPGYVLVGRDDLLATRLDNLRQTQPDATLLDAWLHAARFNHAPIPVAEGEAAPADGKVRWADPLRGKGSGWTVPIPVGYVSLTGKPYAPGEVAHARDTTTPVAFVESVYSLGEWISPHRLQSVSALLWHAETDSAQGLYRCCSGYQPPGADEAAMQDDESDFD